MNSTIENMFDVRLADTPYTSNDEYVEDWIRFMDFKLSFYLTQILRIHEGSGNTLDKYKGLVIGREEILDVLQGMDRVKSSQTDVENRQQQVIDEYFEVQSLIEEYLEVRTNLTIKQGVFLPFAYITHMFELSSFEQHCIILSVLHHIDKKYEKIFGYLQDDVTIKYPNVDLAIKLYAPRRAGVLTSKLAQIVERKLFRYFFIESLEVHNNLNKPLLLDKRMREFIFDIQSIEDARDRSLKMFFPDDDVPDLIVQNEWQKNLDKQILQQDKPMVCFVHGATGSGKKLQIKTLAKRVNKSVVFIKANKMIRSDQSLDTIQINKTIREVLLHDSFLCLTNFEEVIPEGASKEGFSKDGASQERKPILPINDLVAELRGTLDLLFIASRTAWKWQNQGSQYRWMDLEIKQLDRLERSNVWAEGTKQDTLGTDIEVHELANKFRLTPGQISNALQEARDLVQWQGEEAITREILYKACYRQVTHKLDAMASLVFAKYKMEDLILPVEQKQSIIHACDHVTYRHIVLDQWGFEDKLPYGKGLSMLFGGPPGTGKTMAAQVIASELGLEMYKIDLSQIVSKYIGETEKNLQEVFSEAQKSNAILFFDECDSILGKRTEVKDAHDKYANIETSFLLQKIEEFEGVTVLATNFLTNIDSAFLRRIQYVIHFPFPDAVSREQIWRSIYPDQAPIAKQVDFAFLAKQFELSGGNIKNIAVNAAFLAAAKGSDITMQHLIAATKNELTKQGKVVVSSDFGEYGFYLRN